MAAADEVDDDDDDDDEQLEAPDELADEHEFEPRDIEPEPDEGRPPDETVRVLPL